MAQLLAASSLQTVWAAALEQLRDSVSTATYESFLRQTTAVSYDGHSVVLAAPNTFALDWISRKHGSEIREILCDLLGEAVDVQMTVGDAPPPPLPVQRAPSVQVMSAGPQFGAPYDEFGAIPLNLSYTFDNFVVADCNRFAHAAAVQVAKAPGQAYNPLFIHSRIGLGKTHLMQAIGHSIRQRFPHAEVVYVSAENFVNHMISGIRDNTIDAFRTRYRRVDVWLVDDVQFIAAIEGPASEEEFFHTFNTLHQTGKQVVLASDAPPRALRLMNERLRSRLEMGIVADLRCPDVETRIAILEKMAVAEGMSLPRDILELIAKRIESNIRTLRGALIKICAATSMDGKAPVISEVENLIADYSAATSDRRVSMIEIVEAVSARMGIDSDELMGPKRQKDLLWARQVAIYLCRELTDNSLAAIGEFFGGRDHSTVLHSYNKVADLLSDQRVLFLIGELKSQLTSA
jgi:chromosomal replication initiator protein